MITFLIWIGITALMLFAWSGLMWFWFNHSDPNAAGVIFVIWITGCGVLIASGVAIPTFILIILTKG